MRPGIALALVLLVVAAGCGDSGDGGEGVATTEAPTTVPATQSATTEAPTAGSVSVEIDEFLFGPADLSVPVGTEITWRNVHGGVPHTVTAQGGPWEGVDSGRLDGGDTFTFPFAEPGTYTYFCAIHPSMTGSVTVTE